MVLEEHGGILVGFQFDACALVGYRQSHRSGEDDRRFLVGSDQRPEAARFGDRFVTAKVDQTHGECVDFARFEVGEWNRVFQCGLG